MQTLLWGRPGLFVPRLTRTMPMLRGMPWAPAIVYIAYRPPRHELAAKRLEFSRASIEERWPVGRADMNAALDARDVGLASVLEPGYAYYDGRCKLSCDLRVA